MKYLEVIFNYNSSYDFIGDILASELSEIGFESFVQSNGQTVAFVQQKLFSETELQRMLDEFPFEENISYQINEVEEQNWNEEWEKNFFEPIVIADECVIHSTFHTNVPAARYDIIIDPKMSFGTGHHETTGLMIGEILNMDIVGKKVLDMGCGTAVLAILASKRGAQNVLAIDIDDWCTENSLENIALNNAKNIIVETGDASLLTGKQFDIILANINRNILLNDIKIYSQCLIKGGKLYMSGFYKEDIPVIEEELNRNNLLLKKFEEKNNWVVVESEKQ
jgi:ribosomal protein L11 methyltransferase